MTCIVGLRHEGRVYLGGDRFLGRHCNYELMNTPKVFHKDSMIIGVCGSARDANLVEYALEVPDNTRDSINAYLILDFVPALRSLLKDSGAIIINNSEEALNSGFILGIRDKIFKIGCDWQVSEKLAPYTADGSGIEVALGSLFSTQNSAFPEERILLALNAAEAHVPTVRGPFDIVSLNNES